VKGTGQTQTVQKITVWNRQNHAFNTPQSTPERAKADLDGGLSAKAAVNKTAACLITCELDFGTQNCGDAHQSHHNACRYWPKCCKAGFGRPRPARCAIQAQRRAVVAQTGENAALCHHFTTNGAHFSGKSAWNLPLCTPQATERLPEDCLRYETRLQGSCCRLDVGTVRFLKDFTANTLKGHMVGPF